MNTSAVPAELQTLRQGFYERIGEHHMAPLWSRLKSLVPDEPTPVGEPHLWRYAEVRPYLLEAAELISAKEAERRVSWFSRILRSQANRRSPTRSTPACN